MANVTRKTSLDVFCWLARRDGTVVALTTGANYFMVIDLGIRCPQLRVAVASLAFVCRCNVRRWLAGRFASVVATHTIAYNAGMIEAACGNNPRLATRVVAGIARGRRWNMAVALAQSDAAVMTGNAPGRRALK